jgi:transposase
MASVVELEAMIAKLAERVDALERENKILREENAILKRGRFGRSSERLSPDQLNLFAETKAEAQPEPPEIEVPAHNRRKKGHGRAPFADHLPRNVIECDLQEEERSCPCCGKVMLPIGEDVTERGHVIPAAVVVNRYVQKKYACPDGHGVKTAEAPPGVIAGAKFEASTYAWLATTKYADHVPLNRLEGILKRQGVHLPKQTMWDMLARLDELVAQPVLRQMHDELLEEQVLHADETPVSMRLEDGKGSRKGFAFGWRNLRESDESKVLIKFETSRSRDGPTGFLRNWKGTVIVDGYSGYDEVVGNNGIVRAGCWSHARRKLKEALDAGTKDAALVLAPVQRLFWLERAIDRRARRVGLEREAHRELRKQVREKRSKRVIEDIYTVAGNLALKRSTLPKSKLGKALRYLDRQRDPLRVFLKDSRIPIHNNDSERDLRHLAVGRNYVESSVMRSRHGGDRARVA